MGKRQTVIHDLPCFASGVAEICSDMQEAAADGHSLVSVEVVLVFGDGRVDCHAARHPHRAREKDAAATLGGLEIAKARLLSDLMYVPPEEFEDEGD